MPYDKTKVDGYQVKNKETGEVHAKHTTKAKAEAQVRLLHGVEHGMKPRTTRQAAGLDKETRVHRGKHRQSSSRGRASRGGRARK